MVFGPQKKSNSRLVNRIRKMRKLTEREPRLHYQHPYISPSLGKGCWWVMLMRAKGSLFTIQYHEGDGDGDGKFDQ